jgi:uncharacterized membrane protein SpoIIM required for sporulation
VPSPAISTRWIEKRSPHWARLEALIGVCSQRGVSGLSHEELRELALLYRQAAADLATAREDPASAALALRLNQLLGRAHNVIYSSGPQRPRGVLHFYLNVFPRVFRETWPYTMAAFALFLAGAVSGLLLSTVDPGFARFVLGGEMMDTIERQQMWTHPILALKPLASSLIMTNNLAVAFTAFAGGALAGIGTLYLMMLNGVMIGVIGSACHQAGMSVSLWSFVAPHGALELPSIFIAGGAGLRLARGVLAPGTLPRRDAMADAGSQAIRLLLGVVPLLIVAGLVEGFVSPTAAPVALKLVLGGALFVLLGFYLTRGGGARTPAPGEEPDADGG